MTSPHAGNRPLRVLYFTGDLTTGGSEAHLVSLLSGLDRGRVQPEILLLRAVGPYLEAVRRLEVPVHDLRHELGLPAIPMAILRLRTALAELRPDVIHAFGYPCDVMAALAGIGRDGFRVVTSRRGNQQRRRRRLLYRMTNDCVDRIVCVSRSAEEFARRTEHLPRGKTTVIPNGLDLARFPPRHPPSPPLRVLGTLGRLRDVKGSDLLLEAFSRLHREDLRLMMGGPADSPWGRALRSRHEGRPGIRFLGEVDDVPAYLASLDVFVLPSRSEGMSNALMEAMGAGLPIVATRVGGNSELLAQGEAGLLVKPDPAEIAAAIESLIENPVRAASLATAARRRVEKEYSLPVMVLRYERFYAGIRCRENSPPC